ncbi:MAG: Hsp20/alpha crystallin family protein [Acidobacteria bacterium]|nr:Hsp20/alpha crystallin family protein [Acidobacteriota bacterium]
MAISRWDPFRELYSLQNQVNRLFQDSMGQQSSQSGDDFLTAGAFIPPVDVYEDEHNVSLRVEVPGIDPNDLDIRVENNVLTVRGERKWNKEDKEENFHRVERRYGAFSRALTLPNTVSTDDVHANYNSGVLEIKLAKRAEAKPKQIKVGVTASPAPAKTIEGQKKTQAA